MEHYGTRPFLYAIEKMKKEGRSEIYFYAIPGGFRNSDSLIAYCKELGMNAEVIEREEGFRLFRVFW